MNKDIEDSLGKFLKEEAILPKEVKEYLKQSFELKKQQVKIDINRYLDSLPVEDRREAIEDIYEWEIQGRDDKK